MGFRLWGAGRGPPASLWVSGNSCSAVSRAAGVALLPARPGLLFSKLFWPPGWGLLPWQLRRKWAWPRPPGLEGRSLAATLTVQDGVSRLTCERGHLLMT